MENTVTSEEEDPMTLEEKDANSHDFNIPTDHEHLARNCLMKIITAAMKVLVISNVTAVSEMVVSIDQSDEADI